MRKKPTDSSLFSQKVGLLGGSLIQPGTVDYQSLFARAAAAAPPASNRIPTAESPTVPVAGTGAGVGVGFAGVSVGATVVSGALQNLAVRLHSESVEKVNSADSESFSPPEPYQPSKAKPSAGTALRTAWAERDY